MTDGAKPKILVVDDEPNIVKVVRKHLELAGFDVAVAGDGPGGIRAAREWRPDVVVLDVMLPLLDGYAVCAELKHDEALHRIPVLMMTAKTARADREEGLRRGADAYLMKPFPLDELLATIRQLLPSRP